MCVCVCRLSDVCVCCFVTRGTNSTTAESCVPLEQRCKLADTRLQNNRCSSAATVFPLCSAAPLPAEIQVYGTAQKERARARTAKGLADGRKRADTKAHSWAPVFRVSRRAKLHKTGRVQNIWYALCAAECFKISVYFFFLQWVFFFEI